LYDLRISVKASADAALLTWSEVLAAETYSLRYRVVDSINWNLVASSDNSILLDQLVVCTAYEFQLASHCQGGGVSEFSESFEFTTKNCGLCIDLDYCNASGPNLASNTWISEVNIGEVQNASANEYGGYSNFTVFSTSLIQGYYEFVDIKTDHQFFESESLFKIWIDYNQNGIFEDGQELVFEWYLGFLG